MRRGIRKQRRTYSLDPELIGYVETIRRERRIDSASAALEQLLWESKRLRQRRHQEELIANYYSSLEGDEAEREREWGKFAETQFPME